MGWTDNSNQIVNDINLAKTDNKYIAATFFEIEFDINQRLFSLKDLDRVTGTFIRIEQAMQLRDGIIISFGDSHMLVSID